MNIYNWIGIISAIIPAMLIYTDITEDDNVERGKGVVTVGIISTLFSAFLITY